MKRKHGVSRERCSVCRRDFVDDEARQGYKHVRCLGPRMLAFENPDAATHGEIAVRLGISAERVRQIEKSAIAKLRAVFLAIGYEP